MGQPTILMLGHGSRRPRANAEFEAVVEAFAQRRPDLRVRRGYIELADPLLSPALAHAATETDEVVLLPVFLFAAGHLKDDVPSALAQARRAAPRVRFRAAPPLGVHRAMVALALERLHSVLPPELAPGTTLLSVGRGSSDPDANGDFCKLVRLVAEAGRFQRSEPSFIAVTGPRFDEVAERVATSGAGRVVVLPYFLFDGLLVEQLAGQVAAFAARHPALEVRLAPHLGGHPTLLALLEERLDQVRSDGRSLPCDTCPRSA
jgi:sirohydrochlorin ferrochelatase